jgi:hypothetical protein
MTEHLLVRRSAKEDRKGALCTFWEIDIRAYDVAMLGRRFDFEGRDVHIHHNDAPLDACLNLGETACCEFAGDLIFLPPISIKSSSLVC